MISDFICLDLLRDSGGSLSVLLATSNSDGNNNVGLSNTPEQQT